MKEQEREKKRKDAKPQTRQDVDLIEVDEEESMELEAMPEDDSNPMAAFVESARARATEFDDEGEKESDSDSDMEDEAIAVDSSSTRSFSHMFPTVLSQADVLLYVLDARDPLSTRSVSIERQIAAASSGTKRLVLILNKIDLVPPEILKSWLSYLRLYHPTLPLRASKPAPNARTFDHKSLTRSATADALLRALKSYAAAQNLKRALTVGVVGFPNVGKSSVINALVSRLGRSSAPAPVGAEAGVTTSLRNVKLDNKLTLLDSPGVIFPSTGDIATPTPNRVAKLVLENPQIPLVLINALPPKAISDPLPAITLLLARLQQTPSAYEHLLGYYQLPALASSEEVAGDVTNDFLIQVARKRGRLGKGGVPNLESAAKGVLGDWWAGRIGGWVEPPSIDTQASDADRNMAKVSGDEKVVVGEWAKPFVIEGLFGDGDEGQQINSSR